MNVADLFNERRHHRINAVVYVKFQFSHTNAETDSTLSRVVLTYIVMTRVPDSLKTLLSRRLVPRVSKGLYR